MTTRPLYFTLIACLLAGTQAASADQLPALPLSGPAYQIADRAYRAYASGNYSAAIRDAKEAIRLRPDVARLKMLLREAEHARQRRFKPRLVQDTAPPVRPAATPDHGAQGREQATLALTAEQRGELDDALAAIRKAIVVQPEAPQYRLMLVKLLIARGDTAGAEAAAAQAVPSDGDEPMALVFSAYLLQRRGERSAAAALYAKAADSDALGDEDLRNLRLIGADAALAAGDQAQALALLAPLAEQDPEVAQRRKLAAITTTATIAQVLTAPALRCLVNRFGPVCSLFAAGRPSAMLAERAYRAASQQQLPQALALLEQALLIGGGDRELSAQRDSTRRLMAREPAAAAYQALADNHAALAQREIGKAIDFAPDMMAYRLVLIDTLQRQRQYAAAEDAASQAIAIDDENVAPLVMRGYLRQLQDNFPGARGDYLAALASDTLSDDDRRQLGLFIADAALAGGDTQLAADTLAKLPSDDAQAAWRRRLTASGAPRPALLAPSLDCRLTPYGTECAIGPSAMAPNTLIAAVYGAMAHRQPPQAVFLARQLLALAPDQQHYRRILAQALDGNGDHDEAGKLAATLTDPVPDLEFAYLALMANAPELATRAFQQIDAAGQLPQRALQDAGYAAINAGQRRSASGYFRRTVDAARDGGLLLAPQALFDTRRAVAELERDWGGYLALNYRGANPQSGPSNPDALGALGDSLPLGAEAYWRPQALVKKGTYADLYGRLSGTAYSSTDGVTTGAGSLQGALGARIKPLDSQNLVFAFERLLPLGSATRGDWLARAGYSYGDGADLRVDTPSWNSGQVFAEAGRYLQAGSSYFTSEGQLGRSYIAPLSWPKNTVLTPHLVLGADYNDGFSKPEAVGAGVGLSLRHWFREDRYRAPRSYFDLTLQYRIKLAGDERAGGLIVRAILNY